MSAYRENPYAQEIEYEKKINEQLTRRVAEYKERLSVLKGLLVLMLGTLVFSFWLGISLRSKCLDAHYMPAPKTVSPYAIQVSGHDLHLTGVRGLSEYYRKYRELGLSEDLIKTYKIEIIEGPPGIGR